MRTRTYKPGTHINLRKDEYSGLVKVSGFVWEYVLPFLGVVFLVDWMLRANGL